MAVLVVVFVAVQAVPHAADDEIPDNDSVLEDPDYNDNTSTFAEDYHALAGEVGGTLPFAMGVIALFLLVGRVM